MFQAMYCFATLSPLFHGCYKSSGPVIFSELSDFHDWRLKYNKTYHTDSGKTRIGEYYKNWLNNRDYVNSHNMKNLGFHLELNELADENPIYWMRKKNYNIYIASTDFTNYEPEEEEPRLPNAVDWRKSGIVTPVKNQQQCGSCWAFSAVGSMEGQHAKKTGSLLSLSESQLVDCDQNDYGCDGGWMDKAFEYAIKNGMETETDYPYKPMDEKCNFTKLKVHASFSEYKDVIGGEAALKKAVANVGPVSVAIDASNPDFQFYKEGVYYNPECSTTMLDHGVLVVGYGSTDNGTDYWVVKNSWGENWGNKGYIWMARNRNNSCGIATKPSYPIV
jgi:cathepsin L